MAELLGNLRAVVAQAGTDCFAVVLLLEKELEDSVVEKELENLLVLAVPAVHLAVEMCLVDIERIVVGY